MLDFLGGLVGAGLNYYGAKEANKMNQKIAREQMGFQQASSREQMDFQERMSNTSYQRAMADMSAAGLNPILAFQQGGASTPSGSSASGASYEHKNKFAGAVSSALQMKAISAQTDQTKAMTKILDAELAQKKVEAEIFEGKMGKVLKYLQMLSGPTSSVSGLLKLFVK